MKQPRKLKLWNGRCYGVLPRREWDSGAPHIYVAAYSVVDVQALCVELGLLIPTAYEISKFWSAGHWGNGMKGIEVERGIWVQKNYTDTPVRRLPK